MHDDLCLEPEEVGLGRSMEAHIARLFEERDIQRGRQSVEAAGKLVLGDRVVHPLIVCRQLDGTVRTGIATDAQVGGLDDHPPARLRV